MLKKGKVKKRKKGKPVTGPPKASLLKDGDAFSPADKITKSAEGYLEVIQVGRKRHKGSSKRPGVRRQQRESTPKPSAPEPMTAKQGKPIQGKPKPVIKTDTRGPVLKDILAFKVGDSDSEEDSNSDEESDDSEGSSEGSSSKEASGLQDSWLNPFLKHVFYQTAAEEQTLSESDQTALWATRRKAVRDFASGSILYAQFVASIGCFTIALAIESNLYAAQVPITANYSDMLPGPNPFGEKGRSSKAKTRSYLMARCMQLALTGPVAPKSQDFSTEIVEVLAPAWRGYNALADIPKDTGNAGFLKDMSDMKAQIAGLMAASGAKGPSSALLSAQAKTKPNFQGLKKWGSDQSQSVNDFIQGFETATSITPLDMKLFYLRSQMDLQTIQPLFNDQFDPKDPGAKTDSKGELYASAIQWLIQEFSMPEDTDKVMGTLSACKQGGRAIGLYALEFRRLTRKASTFGLESTAPMQKYQFKNGLDSDVKAKMMEDPLYDSWDLAKLIAACKVAEKGLKVSKKSFLASAAENLDTDASLHSATDNAPWQQVKRKSKKPKNAKGAKPEFGKKNKWSNANFKPLYSKKVWQKRQASWGKREDPKLHPELYAMDGFVGTKGDTHPCCILCRKTGHTAGDPHLCEYCHDSKK